jgi:hypothetical protein
MADRVRIGVCTGPADAALVRAMFAAHDIRAVVGGEQHASVMGGLGGGFLSLDIYVSADDADEASALLADFRAQHHEAPDDEDADDEDDESLEASGIESRISARRQIGIALLLAFFISFGTAHLSTRAWFRGLVLATVEIVGFAQLGRGAVFGGLLVGGSMVVDAVGSIVRIRRMHARPALPAARVRR